MPAQHRRFLVTVFSTGLMVCLALTAFGLPQVGASPAEMITTTPSPTQFVTPTRDSSAFTQTAAAQGTAAAATATAFSLTATAFRLTVQPSATFTPFLSVTPTRVGSLTPTRIGSVTPTRVGSATPTPFFSVTPTRIGSATPTRIGSPTPTPFLSATPTRVASATPTPFIPPTSTPTVSATPTRPGGGDFYTLMALHTRFEDYGRPSVSPDGRRVVFAALRDDNWDLYLLNRRTGAVTRLTRNSQPDMAPAWSPGGRYILYQTSSLTPTGPATVDYAVLDVERGYARTVLARGMQWLGNTPPAWSPVGNKFAFADDGEIVVGSVRSPGKFMRFTPPPFGISYAHPAWIDEWRIVFNDGGGLVIGDTRTATVTDVPLDPGLASRPLWSPIHNRIGYNFIDLTGYQLRTVQTDGTQATTLAFLAPPPPPYLMLLHSAWSPDGRFIAGHYDADLSVSVAFNGNYAHVAPMFSLFDVNPGFTDLAGVAWLPDSSGFVFRSAHNDPPGLYLAQLNETAIQIYLANVPPTPTPPPPTPTPWFTETPTMTPWAPTETATPFVPCSTAFEFGGLIYHAPSGQGVPGAVVRLDVPGLPAVVTGPDGRFAMPIPEGDGCFITRLEVEAEGYLSYSLPVSAETLRAHSPNFLVPLEPLGTPTPSCFTAFEFSGLVYNAHSGQGVAGAIVRPNAPHVPAGQTGPDGRFVMLIPEGWSCFITGLEVEADGYAYYFVSTTAEAMRAHSPNFEIPLVPAATATPFVP